MQIDEFIYKDYKHYSHHRAVKIEIPQSVVHIGDKAFHGNTHVRKITINERVKKIGTSAFEDCINLTRIRFIGDPDLIVIPENCFKNCTSLQSMTIPPEVGVIKKYAFSGCTALEHLVIPEHVIAVEAGAFDKWNSNQTIEMYRNFKFGLVCKARIINHSKDNQEVEEDIVYETTDGKYMYGVTCKCGHVGRHRFMPITFPVVASSKKEAAKIARDLPRVKHDHKDAILQVRQLSKPEYEELIQTNNEDPYLKIKSAYQQKPIRELIEARTKPETGNSKY